MQFKKPRKIRLEENCHYKIHKIAAWLDVHPDTLKRHLKSAGIPVIRIKSCQSIHVNQVLALVGAKSVKEYNKMISGG